MVDAAGQMPPEEVQAPFRVGRPREIRRLGLVTSEALQPELWLGLAAALLGPAAL